MSDNFTPEERRQKEALETLPLIEDFLYYFRGKIQGWNVDCASWRSRHFTPMLGYSIVLLSRTFRKEFTKDCLEKHRISIENYEGLFSRFAYSLTDVYPPITLLCYLFGFSAQLALVFSSKKNSVEVDSIVGKTLSKFVNAVVIRRLVEDGGYPEFVRAILEEQHQLCRAMTDAMILRAAMEVNERMDVDKAFVYPELSNLVLLPDLWNEEWQRTRYLCSKYRKQERDERNEEYHKEERRVELQKMMDQYIGWRNMEKVPLKRRMSIKRQRDESVDSRVMLKRSGLN